MYTNDTEESNALISEIDKIKLDNLASFLSKAKPKDLVEYLNQLNDDDSVKYLLFPILYDAMYDVTYDLNSEDKDFSSESAIKEAIYNSLKYNKNEVYFTALEKYNKLLKENIEEGIDNNVHN